MASIINAATSGGLITTADTSGILQLQTAGTTAVTVDASQRAAFVAGTAALPAITTTGDTNTGIFFPAADTIAFSEGGAEAARIDSSGNLGLGVTPSAWGSAYKALQFATTGSLYGEVGDAAVYLGCNVFVDAVGYKYRTTDFSSQYSQENGVHKWLNAASGTAGNAITFTQAMTLDASGRLLVGTTSASNGSHTFKIANSSRMAFDNDGAAPFGLIVQYNSNLNGTSNEFLLCQENNSGGGTSRMAVRSNGGIANYSANNVNLSDRREKTNFAPATSYLDKICAIPVQTFNYIDQNMEEDGGLTLGVVAQDVQAVAPELVMESNWAGKDAEHKMRLSIYQTDLQYALMKCIQEQQVLITTLTQRITALEGAQA